MVVAMGYVSDLGGRGREIIRRRNERRESVTGDEIGDSVVVEVEGRGPGGKSEIENGGRMDYEGAETEGGGVRRSVRCRLRVG